MPIFLECQRTLFKGSSWLHKSMKHLAVQTLKLYLEKLSTPKTITRMMTLTSIYSERLKSESSSSSDSSSSSVSHSCFFFFDEGFTDLDVDLWTPLDLDLHFMTIQHVMYLKAFVTWCMESKGLYLLPVLLLALSCTPSFLSKGMPHSPDSSVKGHTNISHTHSRLSTSKPSEATILVLQVGLLAVYANIALPSSIPWSSL